MYRHSIQHFMSLTWFVMVPPPESMATFWSVVRTPPHPRLNLVVQQNVLIKFFRLLPPFAPRFPAER